MKKYYSLFLAACLLAACDDWTEKNFDIENAATPENVIVKDYTLTEDDYSTIASLKINGIDKDALAAVKKNKYLTPATPADSVLPALMAKKYYTASEGTIITTTYLLAAESPEYLAKMEGATAYEVSAEDYAKVWGDEKTSYFTPAKSAAANLPAILKKGITNVEEGDYAVVTYKYSASEPSSGDEVVETFDPISKVFADATASTAYSITGKVIGIYAQGALVKDETGTILAYVGSKYEGGVVVGDSVKVSGNSSLYGGLWQLGSAVITKVSSDDSFELPKPQVVSGAYLDEYLSKQAISYIQYSGTLKISDSGKGYSYYNIEDVEGATEASGSLQYPTTEMIAKLTPLNGKRVTVTGYAIGYSKKFVNLMVTDVKEEMAYSTVSEVLAMTKGTDCHIKGTVIAEYARGILVKDASGTILVYGNKDYDGACQIGEQVDVYGKSDTYGFGQIADPLIYHISDGTFTQPSPEVLEGSGMDAIYNKPVLKYVSYTGTLKAANSSGADIDVDDTDVNGRIQYPLDGAIDEALIGKKVTVTGYVLGKSTYGDQKQINTLLVNISEAGVATSALYTFTSHRSVTLVASTVAMPSTRAAAVTETRYAFYQYDGKAWAEVKDAAIVNPADYTEMGASNPNFSATFAADKYLPAFMGLKFPYAQEGDVKTAVYHYYASSTTSVRADDYLYKAGEWIKNTIPVDSAVSRCLYKGGKWIVAPNAVFAQDFESVGSTSPADVPGWTAVSAKGNKWYTSLYNNNTYARCSGYGGGGVTEAWLITPAITLPEGYDLQFTFDCEVGYFTAPCLTVLISTDFAGDQAAATWTDITEHFALPTSPTSGYGTFANVGGFDLKEYLGKTIYIAFRLDGDSDGGKTTTYDIDNVSVGVVF